MLHGGTEASRRAGCPRNAASQFRPKGRNCTAQIKDLRRATLGPVGTCAKRKANRRNQPQRRLRLRGRCGAPPHAPAGDLVPCTPFLGLRPREYKVWDGVLLWPCVPIWGYAPSPARAAWRGASICWKGSSGKGAASSDASHGVVDRLNPHLPHGGWGLLL